MKNKLIIILLPISIILLNFNILLEEPSFYHSQFEKNNVYQNIEKETAISIQSNLIAYLTKKTDLNTKPFSEKEVRHFKDVQDLINLGNILLYFSLILILILSIKSKPQKAMIYGSLLTIFIALILSLLSFNNVFIKFHELAFNNLDWLLPSDSTSITLFPFAFFHNFFKTVLIRSSILSIILIIISAQSLKSSNPQ